MSRKAKRSWNEPQSQDRKTNKRYQAQMDNTFDLGEYHRFNKKIDLIPRSVNQEDYVANLLDFNKSIVFALGPAGSGKTMLATQAAIKFLKEGEISKIIITRPAVGVDGEKHGFLPGDLNQKMEPWTRPIFDVFHEHYSVKETTHMLEEGIIEISPLAYLRGRTFKNAFVIADEIQNCSTNMLKMLLTRIGEGSRMVVTGDLKQMDKQFHSDNGLIDFLERLSRGRSQYMAVNYFTVADVQRHPVVAEILKLYGED